MSRKPDRSRAGFTIVELLLGLAISAVLLAAVAVAFNASIKNYKVNEDSFKTMNHARQALFRITTQLRTGWPVDPCAPNNECSFVTADGRDITYQYRNTDNKLYLITNSDGSEYVLCDNVTAMSFIKTPTDDGSDVKSVQISMTVQSGPIQRTLSAAAVVRRNLM
ncbi:MAG: prepilin-type N-terminal cleavage/methylation domain-containing protein [Planctomycetota bacterium]|jgi:prepilin-type N-terminal cleavage/methylation domain-containing protein